MSNPSPYSAIPREQRPPNRRGTGRKSIPTGVTKAIAARGLAGEKQAVLAKEFDVSRDYVKRTVEQARTLDPQDALVMRQHLPDRYLTAAYMSNERAIEAIVEGDQKAATGWAFASKLQTESNRWADKIGDGTGATMLEFIKALNEAGGGSVTVAVNGSAEPGPTVIEAEVIP
jgi:hypothetical protein